MRRLPAALLPAGIFLVACLAFWPALPGEFNWDDDVNLVSNLGYRGFDASQIRWMFTATLMGHYMPFTWLSLAVNHALGQMNPWGYHLASLLLHAANALLVYLVARRLLAAALSHRVGPNAMAAGAAVAALLFALHPQRVESVAWISDRATVLCGTFYLLAVLAYLRAVAAPSGRRGAWWGAASLVAFAAALLSKGMAMSLPITLLILDVYPLRRWRAGGPRVLVEKMPYVALALAGAVVAAVARNQGAEFTGYGSYGVASRIGLIAYSFWFYPLKLVWPADLSPLYEVPRQVSLLDLRFLIPLLGLLVVTGGLVALRQRVPGALTAWAHSAAVVAPVSGVVHSGLQMVADRYSYLAQLGFVVLAGYGLVRILELHGQGRVRRGAVMMAGSGIVLTIGALAVLTWSQSYVWRDPETLWRWAVDKDPACAPCHGNLGAAIASGPSGPARIGEAESHLRRAIELRPGSPVPYFNLGNLLLVRRQYDEAEAAYRRYSELWPASANGQRRLGLLAILRGRYAEAIPLLEHARGVTCRPASAPDIPASALLLRAVNLVEDDPGSLTLLGQSLIEEGKPAEAIGVLRRAVVLAPGVPAARSSLVRGYREIGRGDLAEKELATLRRHHPAAAERLGVR